MNNTIATVKAARNHEQILQLLQQALPENAEVQSQLDTLISNKQSYIKRLVTIWNQRIPPIYTEKGVRETCQAFYQQQERENESRSYRNAGDISMADPKNWIIKQDSGWFGWSPQDNCYMEDPLLFEGQIEFTRHFEPFIVADSKSESINLVWSIKNLIRKGEALGLGDAGFITVFLNLSRKYLPFQFQSLSRHLNDCDKLFQELLSSVNCELEVSKIRQALSTIHRKTSQQIQGPIFRIKSLYQMLISINFPMMDQDKIELRSYYFGTTCITHLVSKTTATVIEQYTTIKAQEGDSTSCRSLCDFVTSHESINKEDQLSNTVYLPKPCSRLDQAAYQASSVSELLVATNQFSKLNLRDSQKGQSPGRGQNYQNRDGNYGRQDFSKDNQRPRSKEGRSPKRSYKDDNRSPKRVY